MESRAEDVAVDVTGGLCEGGDGRGVSCCLCCCGLPVVRLRESSPVTPNISSGPMRERAVFL
ncbi:MAG TPA: hypothetical protein VKS99_14725, partial [Blastocatellia bacterium]|nr:hypothetical protein [Blastocatellia bacterium]